MLIISTRSVDRTICNTQILVIYEDHTERCSYNQLTIQGCQHSGDILEIPNKVGTAEYIDIDVETGDDFSFQIKQTSQIQIYQVPEPGTAIGFIALGVVGLVTRRRKA